MNLNKREIKTRLFKKTELVARVRQRLARANYIVASRERTGFRAKLLVTVRIYYTTCDLSPDITTYSLLLETCHLFHRLSVLMSQNNEIHDCLPRVGLLFHPQLSFCYQSIRKVSGCVTHSQVFFVPWFLCGLRVGVGVDSVKRSHQIYAFHAWPRRSDTRGWLWTPCTDKKKCDCRQELRMRLSCLWNNE